MAEARRQTGTKGIAAEVKRISGSIGNRQPDRRIRRHVQCPDTCGRSVDLTRRLSASTRERVRR